MAGVFLAESVEQEVTLQLVLNGLPRAFQGVGGRAVVPGRPGAPGDTCQPPRWQCERARERERDMRLING
jgi:hypothetical protein